MNVGIIGFGLMGKQRANDISKLGVLHLKSVFDININEVRQCESEYGFKAVENPDEIMTMEDLLKSGATGGAFGAVGHGAGKLLGKAAQGVKKLDAGTIAEALLPSSK